jgi:hypothetical protein
MARRVFAAMQRKPRLIPIPLPVLRAGVATLRLVPRFRHWSPSMADRMNADMAFDHSEALRDFGFRPRLFTLTAADVGSPE